MTLKEWEGGGGGGEATSHVEREELNAKFSIVP